MKTKLQLEHLKPNITTEYLMLADTLRMEMQKTHQFFLSTIKVLEETDSQFKPKDDMYTVAQQVAHTAHTVDWFSDNAFNPEGMTFEQEALEEHDKIVLPYTSLAEAKKWLAEAFVKAAENFGSKSDEELLSLMPEKSLMGPSPRFTCAYGITDHTAHHRGSLAVYVRMLGKVPNMPYML